MGIAVTVIIALIIIGAVILIQRDQYLKKVRQYDRKMEEEIEGKSSQYREDIQAIRGKYEEEKGKLTDYIYHLEKISREPEEMKTHELLRSIKNDLVEANQIAVDEMLISGHVYVPLDERTELSTRQVDHVVLTSRGLYVLETQKWKGHIIHGVSKHNAGTLDFVLDTLYPDVEEDVETTMVFQNTSRGHVRSGTFEVHDSPIEHAKATASITEDFLRREKHNPGEVTPIIFFGHSNTQDDRFVQDVSVDAYTHRFTTEAALRAFFHEQFSQNEPLYSQEQLYQMERSIITTNYVS
ncbi:Nuclease-related domain-containing protein [Marinococcus luteus]|uniref:Nuclease-related domain-containing protein n=1 Tax=Marinococcus luteus TaxID=1122204 RepID=A0A1H2WYK3_9BACI|nr:nuclease-related domain-containing protein [Marinococcus luteus]SDW85637.1 Nuclease-related domain-containing protein [Marinococcus luteus]